MLKTHETSNVEPSINISDKARDRIHILMEDEKVSDNHRLRISVLGGGCSGLQYDLSFDDNIDEAGGDRLEENNSIEFIINVTSLMYILGTTLDYGDGLNGKGLYFENPNASRTCGCGESFSV